MTHTHCTRINLRDGSKSYVEFGEIDGTAFHAKWHGGFYTKVALLIVNRWNYIATLQSRIEYHYYLHTQRREQNETIQSVLWANLGWSSTYTVSELLVLLNQFNVWIHMARCSVLGRATRRAIP